MKIKPVLIFLAMIFLFCSARIFAANSMVSNLTMTPANPNFGDLVTINFDYCSNNASGELIAAVSTFSALQGFPTVGQVLVVSNAGINVPTVGSNGTDLGYKMAMPTGAACIDCGGSATDGDKTQHYTWQFNIPNSNMFPGCNNTSLHLYIGNKDYYEGSGDWTGISGCQLNSLSWSIGVPAKEFTIHKRAEGVLNSTGDYILYSIDYTYGNGQLKITDPLPANLKIVSVGPAAIASGAGAGDTSGIVTWILPDKTGLPGISSGTVWILCQLNSTLASGTTITNTSTGTMGGTPPDQVSSVISTVGQASMSVTKSYGPPGGAFNQFDTITYFLDYQISGSKLGAYESFDEMPLGASYSGATPPPNWEFRPYGANTGIWTVKNPCGTGDNYIQANPNGTSQYPGMLLNTPTGHNFCTGEIMVDAEIEGTWSGADSQIIVRDNGQTGASNYSVGLILSQDSGPAYVGFQITTAGSAGYPGINYPSPLVQLNKWYSVDIMVTQSGNDYVYQAKVWPKGDPEPSAWMASYTQTGGAISPVWRCDGLGNYTDWRPGFNEQGGDDGGNPVLDSFDNFVILNPFTNSSATLFDTVPAGVSYTNYSGAIAPSTTGPVVLWNLGSIADQSGSYTWWGKVTSSCDTISNVAGMGSASAASVFSNEVDVSVSCGSPTFTPTYTNTPTPSASPTQSMTPTDSPTYTETQTPTGTPTPMPAIINVILTPVDPATSVGGTAQIMIIVNNSGAQAVNGVLSATVPAGTTLDLSSTDNAGWSSTTTGPVLPAGSVITRNIGTMYYNASLIYEFTITTDSTLTSGTTINIDPATVTYDDLPPFSTGNVKQSNPAQIQVGDIEIYPNPFNPATAIGGALKFANLPRGTQISIYTISGELVMDFNAKSAYVYWDGKNINKKMSAAGVYYYVLKYNSGKSILTGKIFLIKQ